MSIPTAFAQTDSQFEDMVNQEVELPETGVFKTHDNILNDDGTYLWSTHEPYFETEQGEFVPYRLTQDDSMAQIEIEGGKFVFDKVNGALTIFDSDGIVIDSDSYIVKSATVNTDVWTNLTVNDEAVVTTVDELDDGSAVVTFTRENNEGIFAIEYVYHKGLLKTTAYFTNLSLENQKISFTETLQMVKDITVNEQVIDLNDYVGQTFPREVLEENIDLVLKINDMVYNSGIGFEQLWSVSVHDNRMVSLDYGKQSEDVVEIGSTVELDPTIAATPSIYSDYGSCGSSSGWSGNIANDGYIGKTSGLCAITYIYHSFSLPSGATVTNTDFTYRIQVLSSGTVNTSLYQLPTSTTTDASSFAINTMNASTKYYASTLTGGVYPYPTIALNSNANNDITNYGEINLGAYAGTGASGSQRFIAYGWTHFDVTYSLPAVPDSITPTASTSGGQNTVTWSQPNNNGATIDQYDIYGNGSLLHSINNSPTTTSWTHTNPVLGTSIYYQVYPHNSVGWQIVAPNSNSVTPVGAPSNITNLAVSQSSADQVNLTWSAPSNNGSALTGYTLYPSQGSVTSISSGSTSYTWNAPTSARGTSVNFFLVSANGVGSSGNSNNPSLTMWNVPSTPSAPTATTSGGTNSISWSAPSNVGTAITGYQLYRDGSLYQTLGNVLSYSDTSVTLGTSYYYQIVAGNAVSYGSISGNSATVIPALVPTAPSAPTATFVSNTSNTVTWSAPSANGSAITGYELFRNGSTLGNVGNIVSYTDTGLTIGSSNFYSVKAINGIGASSTSSNSNTILNANVPDAPTSLAAVAGVPITMTWTAPSSDMTITNYKIYRDGTLIQTLGVAGSFSDNTVVGGTTYSYEVSAVSSAGEGNKSSSSSAVAGLPADPPSLGLTHNSANLNINVAITDGSMGTGTLTNYTVERSADGSTNWTSAGTWHYRANTITNHGTSGYSNIVNIAHVDPDTPSITSASYNNPANSNIEVAITNGSSFGTGDFTNYTIE